MSRNLVIYYSRRGQNYCNGKIMELEKGNAELLAEYIAEAAGADIFEIRPEREYPEDYNECTEVARSELRTNERPPLREYLRDISGYDNIFIVGPCWWGTYPMPVFTQLERLDLRGKRILPVMTHEGSGMGSSERDLRKMCRGAKVIRGLAVPGSAAASAREQIAVWSAGNIK